MQRVVMTGGAGAAVNFDSRARENKTKDIAMWLADDEQAEMIEKKEKELLEKGGDDALKKKKKVGGRKREVNVEDFYHEGKSSISSLSNLKLTLRQAKVTLTTQAGSPRALQLQWTTRQRHPSQSVVLVVARASARRQRPPSNDWPLRTALAMSDFGYTLDHGSGNVRHTAMRRFKKDNGEARVYLYRRACARLEVVASGVQKRCSIGGALLETAWACEHAQWAGFLL